MGSGLPDDLATCTPSEIQKRYHRESGGGGGGGGDHVPDPRP